MSPECTGLSGVKFREFRLEGPSETRYPPRLLQKRKLRSGEGKGLVQVTVSSVLSPFPVMILGCLSTHLWDLRP